MALISLIYKHLKTHGRSTLAEITAGTHGIPGEVRDILDIEIARGYIREDAGYYSLKILLGRLTKKEEITPLWKYKEIQRSGIQTSIPQPTLKTLLEALFWWQGGRGSCVGFAGSLYKWLLYMLSTGDIPTIDEIKAAGKIVEEDIGCVSGPLQYTTMARTLFSPQWLYDRSRKFGHVLWPAGSDTTWCAKVIALEGAVPWDECLTSITGLCAPELWPMVEADYDKTLARLAPIAAGHKNNFAASNNFNEVFNAIKEGKSVMGPVNLPPDYLNPPGGVWRPYGGSSAGGHALFCCLTDEENRLIASRGSWDGDNGETWYWFGERFFDENAGPFLIGLTQEEARIGMELYKTAIITCNVPAEIMINGIVVGTSPQKIAIEKGKNYFVIASAPGYYPEAKQITDSTDFVLVPIYEKSWFQKFIDWIMSFRR